MYPLAPLFTYNYIFTLYDSLLPFLFLPHIVFLVPFRGCWQVVQMHIHSNYLHRMTALYAIQVLTESLDVDMLGKVMISCGEVLRRIQ